MADMVGYSSMGACVCITLPWNWLLRAPVIVAVDVGVKHSVPPNPQVVSSHFLFSFISLFLIFDFVLSQLLGFIMTFHNKMLASQHNLSCNKEPF